jgi:streptomycin 6-kinase
MHVPDKVRGTALAGGEQGLAWLARLPRLIDDLEHEWHLSIGRSFSTGTEAFVAEAEMADGQLAVVKVLMPWLDPSQRELATLLAANGRGYARLLRDDPARGVMLLERLGPQLHQLRLPLDTEVAIICATLAAVWAPLADGVSLPSGADKAFALAGFIETSWPALGKPCSERAVDKALRFAGIRRQAFDPERAVMAHGDAHAWNTLLVPDDGPRQFKFVDPDGLFVERAYDLSISMREWSRELLDGDPLELGRQRCARLAALTGVEPVAIWQWGFIERVANGLLLKQGGLDRLADECLAVADTWAVRAPFQA